LPRADQTGRIVAGLIAALALLAMIPPLAGGIERHGGLLGAAWWLGRFFTILTNLGIGIGFGLIAWRGRDAVSPLVQGGLVLAIMLVGLVFNLLLPAVPQATIWSFLGDKVHHLIAPIAVPLWWLLFARHGQLRWTAPLWWALYPLVYAAYVLVRAEFEPAGTQARYPYFFMDVEKLGWLVAMRNMGAIAAAFVLVGWLAVLIDRRLGARQSA
jgi:hypothetical protein